VSTLLRVTMATTFLLVTACALPEDDRPRVIAAEDIPLPSSSTATSAAATGTESVEIWLVRANSDPQVLEPVDHGVPSPGVQSALDALLAAPREGTGEDERYDSAIPEGTTLLAVSVQPVAIIQLGPVDPTLGGVLSIQGQQQVLAFAQIVATAMSIPGVESVRFVLADNSAFGAPIPDGTVTDRAVTDADYASLLDD
jgi:spore germination protein GerM